MSNIGPTVLNRKKQFIMESVKSAIDYKKMISGGMMRKIYQILFFMTIGLYLFWGETKVYSEEDNANFDVCDFELLEDWYIKNQDYITAKAELDKLPKSYHDLIKQIPKLKDIVNCENYEIDDVTHTLENKLGEQEYALYVNEIIDAGLERSFKLRIKVSVEFDITEPKINGTKDWEVEINSQPNFLEGVSAEDEKSRVVLEVDDAHVDLSRIGVYDLTYIATDEYGNTSRITVKVTVYDKTPPIIHNSKDYTIEVYELPDESFFIDNLITTDNSLSDHTDYKVYCEVDLREVKQDQLGQYPFYYICTDESENKTKLKHIITIVDETPPEIIVEELEYLINSGSINYREFVSVSDNYSDLTFEDIFIFDDEVNFNKPGYYPITFSARDENGNITTVTKTIRVYDEDIPEFKQVPELIFQIGSDFDVLEGLIVIDKTDGDITHRVKVIDHFVNYQKIGEYPIIFVITDSSGNTSFYDTTIHLIDDLPPEIITFQELIEVDVFNHTFNFLQFIEARDDYDHEPIITYKHNINFDQIGEYELTFIVRDRSGNETRQQITVRIVDREKPVIEPIDNIKIKKGETINLYDYLNVNDNYNSLVELAIQFYGEYDKETPGEYEMKVVVKDESGNEAEETFKIIVEDVIPPLPNNPSPNNNIMLLSLFGDEKLTYVFSFTAGIILIGLSIRLFQRKKTTKS